MRRNNDGLKNQCWYPKKPNLDSFLEYEEKIVQIFNQQTAELILGTLSLLGNVFTTNIFYNLNLISSDLDDNKFVDCAFAANTNFLVTDDKHYKILKSVGFPKINTLSLAEFSALLETNNP